MKRIFLAALVLALSLSVPLFAQTPEEIETARSVARMYGYSDDEINSILGPETATVRSTSQNNEPVITNPVQAPEPEVTVLQPAAKPEAATGNPIYGHDYFISSGLGVITSYNAPAPDSYILGPGDEVIVDVWGATVSHVVAVIQTDGSIPLSDLGPVYLAGMSLKSAEANLKAQLSRIYAGLADDRGDTFVRLSIGKMKGVVINISGEVVTPGAYIIPSLASLQSAIYKAGGINDTGSVRNITLYRRGKKIANFDLYEFLFSGKANENLRLQDGDVVSVESYHDIATINGAVMRPMKYEFKEGETISDLIKFAGGFTTNAQRSGIHISRQGIGSNKDFDIEASQFASFKLVDGDVISVRSYRSTNENSVTLTGPVKYPGEYAIGKDIYDVASLVRAAGGLIEGAFTGYGQINRLDEDRQPTYVTFDLSKVLDGQSTIALKREDNVVIYSHDDFVANQSVRISGAVANPGVYSFHKGMTVTELIELAGGLSADAYLARGIISHASKEGQPVTAPFNVSEAEAGDGIVLMRDDAVRIYSISELKQESTVSILGEVNAPGEYAFREGITIKDLVDLAMGFTDGVDMTNVQISSRGGRTRGSVETLNLDENPELLNKSLRAYDIVSFRRLTYFRDQTTIVVEGEVMSPGAYMVDKAAVRISDIMAKTGGFTDDAYPHGAKLIRVLTEEEKERQAMAVSIANKSLNETMMIDMNTLADSYTIGIDLEKAIKQPGSNFDVVLRDGDIINVPQMNNTVKISGGVLYPNTVVFDKRMGWRDYIKQAGGFTKLARNGRTYAVYMNGKVATRGRIYIEPGMEIIVPERKASEIKQWNPTEIAALTTSTVSLATLITSIIRLF